MTEQWKIIIINNIETHCEISNLGRCRNINKLHWKTRGILKPKYNKQNGYYTYCIVIDGKNNYKYIHRLVATAYIEGDTSLQVNHIDGNKSNNTTNNLEWLTAKENVRHCFKTGLSNVPKPIKVYSIKGEYINTFSSITEACETLEIKGVSSSVIGKDVASKNYQWRYDDDKTIVKDLSKTNKRGSTGTVQLTMEGKFIAHYKKISQAYKHLDKRDNGVISQVCKGKKEHYLGYRWIYADEYFNK